MDESVQMWQYWREKTDHVFALEEYYMNLLSDSPDLQQAVAAINNAQRAIDKFMEETANA